MKNIWVQSRQSLVRVRMKIKHLYLLTLLSFCLNISVPTFGTDAKEEHIGSRFFRIDCVNPRAPAIKVQLAANERLPYDPATTGFAHITFYNAILGRLVRYKSNLDVEPALLESAGYDFKSGRYLLKLRSDTRFHNGRRVSVEDLDFSLTRFFLSSKRVDQVAFLRHIDGVDQLKAGDKYKAWSVDGIRKVDERTISVKLVTPNPAFLYSLAEGWVSLVPREELQEDFVTWKTVPIGAGPYRVEHVGQYNVEVCRVASDGTPPPRVQFVSDKQPTGDILGFLPVGFAIPQMKKIYGSGPIGFTGLFFNKNNLLARNVHFRRAVNLAIKRREFVAGQSDYSALYEMLTSNFFGRLNTGETHDLSAARSELAMVPKKLIDRPIKAHWFTGRSALMGDDERIVDELKRQLSEIGLNLEFKSSQHPTFAEDDQETVLRVDDRGTAFPDPLVIFRAFERPAFLSPFLPRDSLHLRKLLSDAANAPSIDVKSQAIRSLS